MTILLNGETREVPDGLTVLDLLQSLEIDPRVVAVEVNRAVVRRPRYADTAISRGDEVEIVAFVGGGSRPRFR
jgi:thiamine biosynthesis protein ThiS